MGVVIALSAEAPVRFIASTQRVQVEPDCSIGEMAQAMCRADVPWVIVGTDPTGPAIVTEWDLAGALAAGLGPKDAVSQVVVRRPLLIGPESSVLDAATKMLSERVRHLLVVEDDRLVGILSMRDVMAVLLQSISPQDRSPMLEGLSGSASEIWFG